MRDIDEIMLDRLELNTIDGALAASVNVTDCTITLAVEGNEAGAACISLSPEQARSLAVFLTARADDANAVSRSRKAPTDAEMMEKTPMVRKYIEDSMIRWRRGR